MSDWHPDWAKNQHERRATVEETPDGNFFARWSVTDSWADVRVLKIVNRADGGAPLFHGDEDHPDHASVPPAQWWEISDLDKAEVYLEGHVKWDGCTELGSVDRPHWCGVNGFKNHCALLRYIWERAFSLMGREQDEPWDEPSMEQPSR